MVKQMQSFYLVIKILFLRFLVIEMQLFND
jgi:hypothetical protein